MAAQNDNPQTSVEVVKHDYSTLPEQARAFAASGYFADAPRQSQALTKLLTGQELGIGQMASMTGIHIIIPKQGPAKVMIGSNILAGLLRRHEEYDYRIVDLTDDRCELRFTRGGADLEPTVLFTIKDAAKAGLTEKANWRKHPRNMLFARALSDGVKFHAPDLAMGMPVYSDGDFVEEVQIVNSGPVNDLEVDTEVVEAVVVAPEPDAPELASEGQKAAIAGILGNCEVDDDEMQKQKTAIGIVDDESMTAEQADVLTDWLKTLVGTEAAS